MSHAFPEFWVHLHLNLWKPRNKELRYTSASLCNFNSVLLRCTIFQGGDMDVRHISGILCLNYFKFGSLTLPWAITEHMNFQDNPKQVQHFIVPSREKNPHLNSKSVSVLIWDHHCNRKSEDSVDCCNWRHWKATVARAGWFCILLAESNNSLRHASYALQSTLFSHPKNVQHGECRLALKTVGTWLTGTTIDQSAVAYLIKSYGCGLPFANVLTKYVSSEYTLILMFVLSSKDSKILYND